MDVTKQTKLSKAEWESVEIPVSEDEKRILRSLSALKNFKGARYDTAFFDK